MDNILVQILISVATFVAFVAIFLLIQYSRNYKALKRQKEHFKELHQSIKVGDKIAFSNGFYGTIRGISSDGEKVDVKIKEGIVTISRYAIMEILD